MNINHCPVPEKRVETLAAASGCFDSFGSEAAAAPRSTIRINLAHASADVRIEHMRTPGGVAERLIAPVLKTGRPKGLVSSNLTPSAILLRANALRRIWQGPLREAGCPPKL